MIQDVTLCFYWQLTQDLQAAVNRHRDLAQLINRAVEMWKSKQGVSGKTGVKTSVDR